MKKEEKKKDVYTIKLAPFLVCGRAGSLLPCVFCTGFSPVELRSCEEDQRREGGRLERNRVPGVFFGLAGAGHYEHRPERGEGSTSTLGSSIGTIDVSAGACGECTQSGRAPVVLRSMQICTSHWPRDEHNTAMRLKNLANGLSAGAFSQVKKGVPAADAEAACDWCLSESLSQSWEAPGHRRFPLTSL